MRVLGLTTSRAYCASFGFGRAERDAKRERDIFRAARAPYLPLRRPGPHSVRFTKMLAPSQPRRRSEFRTRHDAPNRAPARSFTMVAKAASAWCWRCGSEFEVRLPERLPANLVARTRWTHSLARGGGRGAKDERSADEIRAELLKRMHAMGFFEEGTASKRAPVISP